MLVFEILIFELCRDKDRIIITVKGMLFCKLQKEKKKNMTGRNIQMTCSYLQFKQSIWINFQKYDWVKEEVWVICSNMWKFGNIKTWKAFSVYVCMVFFIFRVRFGGAGFLHFATENCSKGGKNKPKKNLRVFCL